MKVSTRGRYALRLMIDLVRHNTGEFIPLKDIANRQNISEKYLEAIVKLLVKKQLLLGHRGKNGGYKLSRKPEEYSAWDIISATESEDMAPISCLEKASSPCPQADSCPTLPMWKDWQNTMREFFSKYTLDDLARDHSNPEI